MGLDYKQSANVKPPSEHFVTDSDTSMAERLSKSVADDLLARITRGEYKAGDRLPSEHHLMGEYGVGRNTVREAMQSLRTLGLVDIRPRLGARVLDTAAPNALASSAVSMLLGDQTINELYEVRLILEPAAAAMAAKHRTDEDLLAMRRARTHFRVAYEMGTPVWEADIEFHQAIVEASGNSMLPSVLAPVSDLLKNSRRATGTLPAAVELALEQHEEIAAAIEARASARARRAMTTHIESGIWALGQLKDRAGFDNPPSVSKTTSGSQSGRRQRHVSARRPTALRQTGSDQ
jgi:GntR family transcriptional regulator, transcriptional repressor for pyruvate dehydrogenase complex